MLCFIFILILKIISILNNTRRREEDHVSLPSLYSNLTSWRLDYRGLIISISVVKVRIVDVTDPKLSYRERL